LENICGHVCDYIVAQKLKGQRRLTKAAENFLLTEAQSEELKDRGLTVADCIEGTYGTNNAEFVAALFGNWNGTVGKKVF
jgi:hypothetical protein